MGKVGCYTVRFTVYFCVLLAYGGGSKDAVKDAFIDYIEALNRSSSLEIETGDIPRSLLMLPALRDRQQSLRQFDIGLVDFLSLQGCELGQLIGQRNSILGKVMPASQLLLYEFNLIRAIETCPIASPSLAQALAEIAKIKRTELFKVFANNLWAGAETQVFFSFSNGYLPMSAGASRYQELALSLLYLTQLGGRLSELPQIPVKEFEAHFQTLYESEYAGKLLLTLVDLAHYLNRIADAVESLTPSSRFCGAPMGYLKQQFKVHYIERLQPYMGRINHSAYRILNSFALLQQQTSPMNPVMMNFLDQWSMTNETSYWSIYQAASRRHALAWSGIFKACHLSIK